MSLLGSELAMTNALAQSALATEMLSLAGNDTSSTAVWITADTADTPVTIHSGAPSTTPALRTDDTPRAEARPVPLQRTIEQGPTRSPSTEETAPSQRQSAVVVSLPGLETITVPTFLTELDGATLLSTLRQSSPLEDSTSAPAQSVWRTPIEVRTLATRSAELTATGPVLRQAQDDPSTSSGRAVHSTVRGELVEPQTVSGPEAAPDTESITLENNVIPLSLHLVSSEEVEPGTAVALGLPSFLPFTPLGRQQLAIASGLVARNGSVPTTLVLATPSVAGTEEAGTIPPSVATETDSPAPRSAQTEIARTRSRDDNVVPFVRVDEIADIVAGPVDAESFREGGHKDPMSPKGFLAPPATSITSLSGTYDTPHGEMPQLWQQYGYAPPQVALNHWRQVSRLAEISAEYPPATVPETATRPALILFNSPAPSLFGALPQEQTPTDTTPEWDDTLVAILQQTLEEADYLDSTTGELREMTTAEEGIAFSDFLMELIENQLAPYNLDLLDTLEIIYHKIGFGPWQEQKTVSGTKRSMAMFRERWHDSKRDALMHPFSGRANLLIQVNEFLSHNEMDLAEANEMLRIGTDASILERLIDELDMVERHLFKKPEWLEAMLASLPAEKRSGWFGAFLSVYHQTKEAVVTFLERASATPTQSSRVA